MPMSIDEKQANSKSRIVAVRLAMLTLRLMENWRRFADDFDSAMILVAIVAISGEKLTRNIASSDFAALSKEIPSDQLARCNISSIAAATGLNRETTRRKVAHLASAGLIVRSDDGSVTFSPGLAQDSRIAELIQTQLEALRRTANDLARDLVVIPTEGSWPLFKSVK